MDKRTKQNRTGLYSLDRNRGGPRRGVLPDVTHPKNLSKYQYNSGTMPYMNKGGQTFQNQARARALGMEAGNMSNVQSELAHNHNSKPSIDNPNAIPGSGSSGRLFNAKYKQENPF